MSAVAEPKAAPDKPPGALMNNWMSSITQPAAIAPEPEPAPTPKPTPSPAPKPAPAPPEPPKPTEPAAAVDTEDDAETWPRKAGDWKSYKEKRKGIERELIKERDAIKAERDSIKEEIAKLQKSGPSPELEALKKERDQLSEQLQIVSVEKHPKFKAYFDGKLNSQIELAKSIVGSERAEKAKELLTMPDNAYRRQSLNDFVSDLDPFAAAQFAGVVNAVSQLESEKSSEIAKSSELYKRMTTEQGEAAKQAREKSVKQVETAFDDILKKSQDPKDGIIVFQTKDGDEAWNKEVTERIDSAKNLLFGKTPPSELARSALYASAFPALLQSYIADQKAKAEEISKLTKQVEALTASTPGLRNGTQPKPPTPGPRPTNLSPQAAIGDWMKRNTAPTE